MSSSEIRKIMSLMELDLKPSTEPPRDKKGRVLDDHIAYAELEDRVIASLVSHESASYTKLAQKFMRIKELEKEAKELKEGMNDELKSSVIDLFAAEDAVKSRVVETLQFVFTVSKNPKPTVTVEYAKVIKALNAHLTPELIKIMEDLVKQFTKKPVQKAPSMRVRDKNAPEEDDDEPATESAKLSLRAHVTAIQEQVIAEGLWDSIREAASRFKDFIFNWGVGYDRRLDALKAQVSSINMQESSNTTPDIDLGGFMGIGKKKIAESATRQMSAFRSMVNEDDGEMERTYSGQYQALTDVFPSGNSEIWYADSEFGRDARMGAKWLSAHSQLPTAADLESHYVKVGSVQTSDRDEIFNMMQGENWSPRGEARNLIRSLGLDHTSMSVGDVMVVDGKAYMVDNMGFVLLPQAGDLTQEDFTSAPDMAFEHQVASDYDALLHEGPEFTSDEDQDVGDPFAGTKDMAFRVGDIVYHGSKKGRITKGSVPGAPNLFVVDIGGGNMDVFPKDEVTTTKPSLLSRAAKFVVGESDDEFAGEENVGDADDEDFEEKTDESMNEDVEARDLVWTHDYTTWFENKGRLQAVKSEKYKVWVANPENPEEPMLAAEWQPAKRQGYVDVSFLATISKRLVRNAFTD